VRPRLLDAYCCEGGASVGYYRAGFDVTGVDLFEDYTQARYPFLSHRADAVGFIREFGYLFDVIVGSPPCQRHSIATSAIDRSGYPDLIGATREAMIASGKPYVLENVVGAPLHDPIMLCGSMFNLTATDDDGTPLRMERHRLFESNLPVAAPGSCRHDKSVDVGGSYGGARRDRHEAKHVRHGGYVPSIRVQQELLGIDWMTQKGMHQSIPPVYTQHIGDQIMFALDTPWLTEMLERSA
jgi:DNA (cytosine-5)-methyltransferase 1